MSLTFSDLKIYTLIGRGSYSNINVYMAKHLSTKEGYAVKRINLEETELPLEHLQNEVWMMRCIRHKHILSLLSVHLSQQSINLVSPLYDFGSCKDLLQAHFHSGLAEMAICMILRPVLLALEHLHSQHIIHRSIKASHVLVRSDGQVVLGGLRHCFSMVQKGTRLTSVHDFPDHYIHNLNWASRELLEQNLSGYNTKTDIYSVGMLSCELANGVVPFFDSPMTQMLLNRIEGQLPVLIDASTYAEFNKDSSIPEVYQRTFSEHFHDLVTKSLSYNPQERPSATALLAHCFFKQAKTASPKLLCDLLTPVSPLNLLAINNSDPEIESDLEKLSLHTEQWD